MSKSTPKDGTLAYANMSYNDARDNLTWMYQTAQNAVINEGSAQTSTIDAARHAFSAEAHPFVMAATDSVKELQKYLGMAVDGQPALTGAQITDKLRSTPGYQFAFDQGNQAVQRTAAAGGMLSSGNALLEAQKFGQGLADSSYQSHIQNLLGLTNATVPIVGADLGDISASGAAKANIQGNKAGLLAQIYMNQGNQLSQIYTQKGNSNLAYAMQQANLGAAAAQNAQVGAGAMAGLSASGYLGGKF